MWSSLSLRWKLALSFSAIVLLMGVTNLVISVAMRNLAGTTQELEAAAKRRGAIGRVVLEATRVHDLARQVALDGDGHVDVLNAHVTRLESALSTLDKIPFAAADRPLVSELRAAIAPEVNWARGVAASGRGRVRAFEEASAVTDGIAAGLDRGSELWSRADAEAAQLSVLTEHTVHRARTLSVVLLLGGLLVCFAISMWESRRLVHPIEQLSAAASRSAGGDFTVRFDTSSRDEVGTLARSFQRLMETLRGLSDRTQRIAAGDLSVEIEGDNALADSFKTMVENLRTVLHELQSAAVEMSHASEQILTAAEEHASGSNQQAASISEVTATLEELSATARQIAESSGRVEEIAAETTGQARTGAESVNAAVTAMNAIRTRVDEIAEKTLLLGNRNQRIGEVLEIIKDIADEIHLLALNAAIESAAAGEHGKRFAVVAAEVRRLAERSRASTEEIRAIIGEITAATSASVLATEHGAKEVEAGARVANSAGEALDDIVRMVERTTLSARDISLATQQQRSSSEQIVGTMREISEVVRESATGMRQAVSAAQTLATQAAQLTEKVAMFRLDAHPAPRVFPLETGAESQRRAA